MTQKARLPVIVAGEVHDPLDWLEHDDASTLAWRQDQAEQAIGWLSSIPCDSAWLRDEIRSALAYPTRAVPVGKAGRYFFLCSPAGADRASLWQSCSPAEDGREIAHPAVFDRADGKAEFRAVWPSFDGGKVIVAVTFGGRQSTQLVVLGIDDGAGATVLECLDTPAFAWAVWHDDRSFFWSRRVDGRQLLSRRTLDGDDAPVALPCDTAQAGVVPFVSEDGAWLVVLTYAPGVAGSRLFAAVNRPDPVFAELDGFQRDGIAIGWWSGNGLVLVPKSHGGGREVVEVDFTPLLDGRSPTNRILYRDDAGKLTGACALPGGGILLVERAADGGNGFRLLSADGALADVEAPSGVALGEWTIDHRGSRLLANFRQWDSPARLMAFDADGRRFQVLRGGSSDLPLVSTRMEVEAADGVAIPVTMIGPAGAGEKRPAPCILWGYGAFGLSIAPDCMGAFLPWFQAGGIVAVAHVRGGGELGPAWHEAGRGRNKRVSFTDLIRVARWLAEDGHTTAQSLCLWGWSAGGMLTLGTAVMAPDICAGVVAENPLTDMAKFSRFRDDGKLWIVEFGDTSGDAAALAAAAEWSPLHNLQPGRDYPATLIMACGNDQRVSPIHGRKMTAALQATGSRGPHLLLEKDGAGHGGAVTRDETAATRAEMLRFAAARTGLVWPKARAGG